MEKERNTFNVMYGIGKCKYVVNYHTVGNYHKDGSEFFDVHIVSNKRKLAQFIRELKGKGYVEVAY